MHRSGTSCLIGSLQQHGLFLADAGTRNATNRLRENWDIVALHQDMLRKKNGNWDAPPAVVEWLPEHFAKAQQILAEYAGHPVWGFKDPRTLLTFAGWQKLVPDIEAVGIFRHPSLVAKSLKATHYEVPLEKGVALWQTYNRHLLELHRRRPFPIVSFDEEAPVFQAKLMQIVEMLGLEPSPAGEPFFAEELRHAGSAGGPLPPETEKLYRELAAVAL
jgi:hypothetical protein